MLLACTLFGLILIHALIYISWIPVFQGLSTNLKRVFPVLNPTYLYDQVFDSGSLGIWRRSLVFSGSAATVIFAVIACTTIPWIRQRHFNFFYFTHLSAIVAVVVICLHASTMFYCTAPGLAMWVLDWAMRFYELRRELPGGVQDLSRGWYL